MVSQTGMEVSELLADPFSPSVVVLSAGGYFLSRNQMAAMQVSLNCASRGAGVCRFDGRIRRSDHLHVALLQCLKDFVARADGALRAQAGTINRLQVCWHTWHTCVSG